ncbi:MAG: hypothetical protein P1U86_20950 [Verrucomicrobiales bacterium]|nr:hypothetical protein [Verrucomicrobiales bacterium]
MAREVRIYCPECKWEPRPADRWWCRDSCGCVWNTFDTGGVCPECGKAWAETQCLSCHRYSPHRSWYHQLGEDPLKEAVTRETTKML